MKRFIKLLIFLIVSFSLQGCDSEDLCEEWYIADYEYLEQPDGSVIAGKPIYRCRVYAE